MTKLALGFLLVAGCIVQPDPGPGPEPDYGSGGWTGSGGGPISYGCHQDSDCGANVCSRDGACYPAANIRAVHVSWTIAGKPASTATCTSHPNLAIHFSTASGASFGYAPVPCRNGAFTIDKLYTSYSRVELMVESAQAGRAAAINSEGYATIDLP